MKNKHYSKNKKCLDCNKIINNQAERCKSCNNKYLRKIGRINTSGKKHPLYGKKGKLNPNWGKKRSEESKNKMKEKFKKEKHPSWKGGKPNCINCNKKLSDYRAIYCKKCALEKINKDIKRLKGEKHPQWKGGRRNCVDCGEKTSDYYSIRCDSCYRKFYRGENHHNWRGGRSFKPYPLGWTITFKEQIRYRDGYKCQLCGKPEIEIGRKLDVHHIDYNKKNIKEINLVSLCKSCHCKTNFNRKYWEKLFKERIKYDREKNRTTC